MKKFKAALVDKASTKIAVVYTESVFLSSQEKLTQRLKFFQENFFMDRKVVLLLLDKQLPVFFGEETVVHKIDDIPWKSLPWKEYEVSMSVSF